MNKALLWAKPSLRLCLPLLLAFVLLWRGAIIGESSGLREKNPSPFATPTSTSVASGAEEPSLGREVAVSRHLQDGEEFSLAIADLIDHGRHLFEAAWTIEEGAGRPLMKGTGILLADPTHPLTFPRNFNRVSGPDANSCAGCHNRPTVGGSGDFVTNVFVLGQRFDFATFAEDDIVPGRSGLDEQGRPITPESIGNLRATTGMFGSGYVEMLARQITADLQTIRDQIGPGESRRLVSKGINFGVLSRTQEGIWQASDVEGIPAQSLKSNGPLDPPDLIVRPFHQSGTVISLREFTNSAFNHHHGIQSTERFGIYTDPDGDGVVDELTRADVTATVLFQATLPVPGRVIPNHPIIEAAVLQGEQIFDQIGCTVCHIPTLPLDREGWIFSEPNPYNPARNLLIGDAPSLAVDLGDPALPGPRLQPENGVVHVPIYTDFKLHDITSGPDDPNAELLDLNQVGNREQMFAGNRRFLTARLWGVANQPPYFHHGKFTTMREAVLAHAGEAEESRRAFEALSNDERNAVIEFLKTLQILPADSQHRIVDEQGSPKVWPPASIPSSVSTEE
ncbi:thiol oxidoreductase [bacterium]|nr:thiol oxidoreductase [bacterium]